MADAQRAHVLCPRWAKPLHRLAAAQLAAGRAAAAVASCRAGEALSAPSAGGRSDFGSLLDRAAVVGMLCGNAAGFDGVQLEVRWAALGCDAMRCDGLGAGWRGGVARARLAASAAGC